MGGLASKDKAHRIGTRKVSFQQEVGIMSLESRKRPIKVRAREPYQDRKS